MSAGVVVQRPLVGVLLLIGAMTTFSLVDTLIKHLALRNPVPLVLWGRYFFSAALMVLLFMPRMRTALWRTRRPWTQAIRGAVLVASSTFFYFAISNMPIADATAINFVAPLLVTVAAVLWLKEHASPVTWMALAASLVGLLLIVKPGATVFSPVSLLPLGSAVMFAAYQILTRKLAPIDDPVTTLFLGTAVGAVVTSLLLPWIWQMPQDPRDRIWMVVTGAGGGFGHYLLIRAFSHASAAMLSPFIYSQLVIIVALGWIVFAEFPDALALVGIAVIAASGVVNAFVQWRSARRS